MKKELFDGLYSNWAGDFPAWLREHAGTNDEQI